MEERHRQLYAVSLSLTPYCCREGKANRVISAPGEEKGKASSSKHRSNEGPAANLEPEGEHSGPDTQEEAGSASGESYDEQASDWFKRGRYLKIFARHGIHVDREIHEKEFILLDSKNIEGKGVRVDRIEKKKEEDSGWESTTVRLVDPRKKAPEERSEVASGSAITARSPLFFDAIGPDNREMENRYVRLEHTYNIPFFKYRCKDLGKLKLESLRRLRLRYVEHLMNEWNLVDQVRELLEGQPTQSYPASVRESSRATTPATSLLNVEGVTTSVLRGKKKANPTTSSLS